MTDRELLELAAKAAGIELDVRSEEEFCTRTKDDVHWNPLTDDGDAIRLAVKLRIDVTFNSEDVFAFPPDGSEGAAELINVDDSYAATRRAIVRAAAEIGRECREAQRTHPQPPLQHHVDPITSTNTHL